MKNKKILIVTASFGNGHITASNSLAEKFCAQGFEVEIFDIAKQTWGGKLLNFLFKISPASILEKIFNKTNTAIPSKGDTILGKILFGRGIQKKLKKSMPDKIWCTFPLVTPEIRKNFSGEICIQITDYFSPHLSWGWGSPDKIFCLDSESKKKLEENFPNISPKNIQIEKFPLPKKILQINKNSSEENQKIKHKAKIKKKYSLPEKFLEKKIIVLFFHHVLLGNEQEIIEKIQNHTKFSDYFICVLAGNNTKKFLQYEDNKKIKNIKIFSWIQNIEKFYIIGDIIGGKCGGAFSSEVMYLQKPLLITGVFSGQEKGNFEYLKKYYSDNLIVLSSKL